MTPEQHAKAIERAANIYATAAAAAALNKPGGSAMALEARESLRGAIRAGVGAAPAQSDILIVNLRHNLRVSQGAFRRVSERLDAAEKRGEVVVTTNPLTGECAAVTRQDEDGRILSVIWESSAPKP